MTKKGDELYVVAWAYEGYLQGTAVFEALKGANSFVTDLKRNCRKRKAGVPPLDLFIKKETVH